jgi:GNAT superfamily N-acetyltransferase
MGNGPSARRQGWRVTSGEPDPATVERLLRRLPTWFGIESSVLEYIESARGLPAYLAWPQGPAAAGHPPDLAAGVLLAVRHFPRSAEIYLMAVDPAVHRQGAGRALITALESDLSADGVEFLQVKTLGPSHPDLGYARTRQFYASVGFQPLEEIAGLWPGNPCLIMIKTIQPRRGEVQAAGDVQRRPG